MAVEHGQLHVLGSEEKIDDERSGRLGLERGERLTDCSPAPPPRPRSSCMYARPQPPLPRGARALPAARAPWLAGPSARKAPAAAVGAAKVRGRSAELPPPASPPGSAASPPRPAVRGAPGRWTTGVAFRPRVRSLARSRSRVCACVPACALCPECVPTAEGRGFLVPKFVNETPEIGGEGDPLLSFARSSQLRPSILE